MPKLYQAWPGNNRFYCGCCITGPSKDIPGIICILICLAFILVPYTIFIMTQNWSITPALPLILYIFSALMLGFLFLTSCTDPGIIPRRPFLLRENEKYQRFININTNSKDKMCQTCHIIRPNRASHCSSCQNCVQVFDHHCSILGNCIGKRNYRYFCLFLACLIFTIISLIINLLVFIINKVYQSINQVTVTIITLLIGSILGLPILVFFIFHLYSCITGRTTREILKDKDQIENSQQSRWLNIDPSLIDFYQQISQSEQQQLSRSIIKMRNELNPVTNHTNELALN